MDKIHNIVAAAVLAPAMRSIKNDFMMQVRGHMRPTQEDDELFARCERAAREAIERELRMAVNPTRGQKKPVVKLVFKKDKKTGEVIALFCQCNNGKIPMYAHQGQHSTCDFGYVISQVKNAKPEEYASLLKELQGIYHDSELKVMKNFSV